MKFQFQFAGANLDRPDPARRKWLRNGLLVVAVLVAGLAYWQYLHYLMHGRAAVAAHATAETVVSAHTVPKPMVKKVGGQVSVALAQTTAAKAALGSPLVVAMRPPVVANPPVAAPEVVVVSPVAAPVAHVAPRPVEHYSPPAPTPEQRLMSAAQQAFGIILGQAGQYPDAFGFGPTDAFGSAKLGEAIPVYSIAEADRARYKSGQAVKPLLKPANQWVFPICVGSHICCMVQVQYNGQGYVPGSGTRSLAIAWNKILQRWPASEGFHPKLVVNPAIPGYFFTVPEAPVPNMTDISEMFYDHPKLSPATVILASWR